MLRTNLVFRSLAGEASPFLYAKVPSVLREMLSKNATKANINQAMNVVAREHMSFGQASSFSLAQNDLVQIAAKVDPGSIDAAIAYYIDEKKGDLPFFTTLLSHASPTQINNALKQAVKNDDMNSVKIILPFVKNERALDRLFTELRNTTKISLEMIKELLPRCSLQVQKQYLKEMIIQRNADAVKEILKFCKPDESHRELAKRFFFSSATVSILSKTSQAAKNRLLEIPGIVNTDFVKDAFISAKESGKQMVITGAQMMKGAVRRTLEKMSLLSPYNEIVSFEGIVPGEETHHAGDDHYYTQLDSQFVHLFRGFGFEGLELPFGGTTLSGNEEPAGLIGNEERHALTAEERLQLREGKDQHLLTGTSRSEPNDEQEIPGFRSNYRMNGTAFVIAGLLTSYMMNRAPAVVEEKEEMPAPVNTTPVVVEEAVEMSVPVNATPVVESFAESVDRVIDEALKPVRAPRNPNKWEIGLQRMDADLRAGYWRL